MKKKGLYIEILSIGKYDKDTNIKKIVVPMCFLISPYYKKNMGLRSK